MFGGSGEKQCIRICIVNGLHFWQKNPTVQNPITFAAGLGCPSSLFAPAHTNTSADHHTGARPDCQIITLADYHIVPYVKKTAHR
jgi:hypothetical protein